VQIRSEHLGRRQFRQKLAIPLAELERILEIGKISEWPGRLTGNLLGRPIARHQSGKKLGPRRYKGNLTHQCAHSFGAELESLWACQFQKCAEITLRRGDVLATSHALVAYSGIRISNEQTPDITPVTSSSGLMPGMYARLKRCRSCLCQLTWRQATAATPRLRARRSRRRPLRRSMDPRATSAEMWIDAAIQAARTQKSRHAI